MLGLDLQGFDLRFGFGQRHAQQFDLFAVAGLWAFHEPRLRVVTTGLWGSGLACAGILLILGTRA